MIRALALIILAALVIAAIAAGEHQPNDGLPLVRVDFQVCVPVQTPPLAKPRGIMPTHNSELT